VGDGDEDAGSISRLLEQTTEKSSLQPAPAEGLVLWDTDVGVTWTCLPAGDRSTHFMDHLCRHHALMEKVCRLLKSS
jgi:tRNA pseudouridine38-40 synthase